MTKRSIPLLSAAVIIGTALGGTVRYSIHQDKPTSPVYENKASSNIVASQDSRSGATENSLPRPTLDELFSAEDKEIAALLSRYLEGASFEEIVELLEALPKQSWALQQLAWMVYLRGVELDPERLVTWAKSESWQSNLYQVFTAWARVDPHSALEASLSERPHIRSSAIRGLKQADLDQAIAALKAVIPDSPELKALQELQGTPSPELSISEELEAGLALDDPKERKNALEDVVKRWAKDDAAAALRWLEGEQDLDDVEGLIAIAIASLAETQPALAQSKVEALPMSTERGLLEAKVIRQWGKLDPGGAKNWLKSIPTGLRRDRLFGSMIQEMEYKPADLFTLVKELEIKVPQDWGSTQFDVRMDDTYASIDKDRMRISGLLDAAAMEIAKESPKEAFRMLYSVGSDGQAIYRIPTDWAKDAPEEAAEWVMNLPETEFTSRIQEHLLSTWLPRDPAAAAAFFTEHNLLEQSDMIKDIARHWVPKDLDAAFAWADGLTGEIRETLFPRTLAEVAKVEPAMALQYVNDLADSRAQQNVIKLAAETWRERDPEGVMGWLQAQPIEAQIESVLKDTTKAWVLHQPQAASEWIHAMENGVRRDHAVAGMVHALISSTNPNKDFESAETWVQTIADPQIKQQWTEEIERRR